MTIIGKYFQSSLFLCADASNQHPEINHKLDEKSRKTNILASIQNVLIYSAGSSQNYKDDIDIY